MAKREGTKNDAQDGGRGNSTTNQKTDKDRVTSDDPPGRSRRPWGPFGKGKGGGGGQPYPEPPSIEPPENWR